MCIPTSGKDVDVVNIGRWLQAPSSEPPQMSENVPEPTLRIKKQRGEIGQSNRKTKFIKKTMLLVTSIGAAALQCGRAGANLGSLGKSVVWNS
jgi:hypothetical protein